MHNYSGLVDAAGTDQIFLVPLQKIVGSANNFLQRHKIFFALQSRAGVFDLEKVLNSYRFLY
ncbi:hypothetical protein KDA_60010 [Dictyobacter alpinus]|uniref:Uncharacterized protein n=1 Tax=Dictyobacter alpinus TaxID=2014873 RepID=A0A402BGZ7_9CHLR|nr:hypothetical protein [Dictyobacter alpinus]GCE30517.1 hypothetical protein KDA_60010 [Dictyobacter alpinus]